MIYFRINVQNPLWRNRFDNVKCWSGKTPWKNKFWELQIMEDASLIAVELDCTLFRDHAGLTLEVGLLGYSVNFKIYDNRHWDTEKDCWVKYDDSDEIANTHSRQK
jgi:hypothetical protein